MSFLDPFRKGSRNHLSFIDELAEFYKQNKSIVFDYFIRLTYSIQDSEELTQETFYQAVKSLHRFKGQSSLKTWLLQIARNVYRNKVRSWAKQRKFFSSAENIEKHHDEKDNPQFITDQKQSKNEIHFILRLLPDDYRDVLIFKEIEGLSHMEIAQILNKTPQTTRVLLYRAKERFKVLYEKEVKKHDETM